MLKPIKNIMLLATSLGVVILTPLIAFANETNSSPTQSDRALFVAAERAQRSGNTDSYKRMKSTLTDHHYPLVPYLEYTQIKKQISSGALPTTAVRAFLEQEEGSILEGRLREYWLKHLAQKKLWPLYAQDYKDMNNRELLCFDIYARYKNTQDPKILNEAQPLWLYAKSQPDACNTVFRVWKETGGLTTALVWDRIKLAMSSNQYTLVNYLKTSLPAADQYVIQTWLNVYRDPKLVTSERLFKNAHPFLRTIQVYGIKRIAKRNVDQAMTLWRSIEHKFTFTPDQKMEVYRCFALELAMKHDLKANDWFSKIDRPHTDLAVYEWELRLNLWTQSWKNVADIAAHLPEPLNTNPTWIYWHARALDELGHSKEATSLYDSILQEREFPGFMASDKRNKPYPIKEKPPEVTAAQKESLLNKPAIARSIELRNIGRLNDARREWDYATRLMNEEDMQIAATLAYEMGWYDRAILTLSHAENRSNMTVRFPIAFNATVIKESNKRGINPAWVYAIVRRESAFVPDARSPVGAMGLMQLMPYTAKQMAKEIGEPYVSPAQLVEADKNIRLGSAYLGKMYRSLNSNIILATAAYNAGPHRVMQWLPPKGSTMEPDIWIENIPFHETREYVKSVLTYRMIYENHLGKDGKLQDVLIKIHRF